MKVLICDLKSNQLGMSFGYEHLINLTQNNPYNQNFGGVKKGDIVSSPYQNKSLTYKVKEIELSAHYIILKCKTWLSQ